MKTQPAQRFSKKYDALPEKIKRKLDKQLKFLTLNLLHPSLHAKKYNETQDIWQARIDKKRRFYFNIKGETYFLLDIIKHKG